MNVQSLKAGVTVVTARQIEGIAGNGITTEALRNRHPATHGVVKNPIDGQRGEVWLVQHSDGTVAPYHHDELVSCTNAAMPKGFRPGA